MIIKIPVRYEGATGEKILYTLFDSGSTFSCIHPDFVDEIAPAQQMRVPLEVSTANKGTYMKITDKLHSEFYIDDIRMSDEFMVVPNLSEEAIIGVTTMQKWRIKLDFEHDTVVIDPKIAKAILKEMK
jgi:hypothetical protein